MVEENGVGHDIELIRPDLTQNYFKYQKVLSDIKSKLKIKVKYHLDFVVNDIQVIFRISNNDRDYCLKVAIELSKK